MEEQLNSLAVTHLLQHTLRSLCIHDNSQWVYAVFWRILPRNYPPPKWDSQGGVYDRSRGVRRNWILVWEDGFCNFAASTTAEINGGGGGGGGEYGSSSSSPCDQYQHFNNNNNNNNQGLQPELFFKMSHEIYNYGEGLIGKVAADHSHKWIHKEPTDQEINFLSAWHNSADSQPRTWEAQFQSGIKTIALIAVREGVIQLGAVHKVIEDLSYVVLLRKKLSYIESIPGVLLPHPSSSNFKIDQHHHHPQQQQQDQWHNGNNNNSYIHPAQGDYYDHFAHQPMKVTPSMSSLEALLSKLPSVVPSSSSFDPQNDHFNHLRPPILMGANNKMAKEEEGGGDDDDDENVAAATAGEPPYHHHFAYHHDLNVSSSMDNNNNNGC